MILLSLALLGLILFLGLRYIYSYWERHELPHVKPEIPYGNLRPVAERRECFGVAISELYKKSTEQLLGIYLFFAPAIMVRDARLAKQIMTSDFASFHDRGVFVDERNDPFSANLFALPGKKWRTLRNKLTPTFTSGKLRNMLPTILDESKRFQDYLTRVVGDKGDTVEMRDLASRYIVDIIASVFFGFEADSMNDPEHPFRVVGREAVADSFSNNIRSAATFVCPGLLKLIQIPSTPPKISGFMIDLVKQQMEYREKNNVSRKDFFQQLVDLRKEDLLKGEDTMSIEECAAQVFLFYIAGSETTSVTITYTLHELSHNSKAMEQLVAEIDETLAKSNGEINYDIVKGMRYLDVCVKETLRKYPGLPILNRECTQDFQVPQSKVVIKKGTQIIIPISAYGMDERYFPDPDSYIPERFFEESKNYDDNAYQPFGDGPRNCIGIRMGVFVAKAALIMLLSNFTFEATQGPKIEFAASSVTLLPKGGIKFKVGQRKVKAA
uniref:Cytochrome P450 n=1 Tax=Culex quinquefasciatus TaxID=7176 RepID=D3KSC3_CULQU|nr:cytochrome P450 [Culex quinquefasciatus]